MINPTKEAVQVAEENHSVYKALAFLVILRSKKAVEVIEAVEVIMTDGANEATEVIRFT